jgi:hypothetical protein
MPYKDPEVRKAYLRDYQARWYADPVNRAKHIRAVMKNSAATAETFAERVRQFKSKPCMHCGQTFDPVCMDFAMLSVRIVTGFEPNRGGSLL